MGLQLILLPLLGAVIRTEHLGDQKVFIKRRMCQEAAGPTGCPQPSQTSWAALTLPGSLLSEAGFPHSRWQWYKDECRLCIFMFCHTFLSLAGGFAVRLRPVQRRGHLPWRLPG